MSQAGRALHLVNKNQFLDSPEWFGVTTDEYFQVEYLKANATLYPTFIFPGQCDGAGARDPADLAQGPGQVLSDGGRQAPGHLRPRGGERRSEETHAGHYQDSRFQWPFV